MGESNLHCPYCQGYIEVEVYDDMHIERTCECGAIVTAIIKTRWKEAEKREGQAQ